MKQFILLLFLLLLMGESFAQKGKKEVVYLNTGQVIKGRCIPVDDEKVVVRSGRNIWLVNYSQIDSVKSKLPSGNSSGDVSKSYFLKTNAGILLGSSGNTKDAPFTFDASVNLKLLGKLYGGLGMGIDFLEESYMPVFASLDYHFRDSRFTPYIGIRGGYMLPLEKEVYTQNYYYYEPWMSYRPPQNGVQTLENKGGLMFNPSIGFISHINQNLGWTLSFGYRWHRIDFEGEDHLGLETTYNRLSMSIGLLFN